MFPFGDTPCAALVDAAKILSFLGSYATHPNATSAKGPVLADFITKMIEIGQLKQWSVALLAEGDGVGDPHAFSGGINIKSFPLRTPDEPKNPDQPKDPAKFAIGVLTDPRISVGPAQDGTPGSQVD